MVSYFPRVTNPSAIASYLGYTILFLFVMVESTETFMFFGKKKNSTPPVTAATAPESETNVKEYTFPVAVRLKKPLEKGQIAYVVMKETGNNNDNVGIWSMFNNNIQETTFFGQSGLIDKKVNINVLNKDCKAIDVEYYEVKKVKSELYNYIVRWPNDNPLKTKTQLELVQGVKLTPIFDNSDTTQIIQGAINVNHSNIEIKGPTMTPKEKSLLKSRLFTIELKPLTVNESDPETARRNSLFKEIFDKLEPVASDQNLYCRQQLSIVPNLETPNSQVSAVGLDVNDQSGQAQPVRSSSMISLPNVNVTKWTNERAKELCNKIDNLSTKLTKYKEYKSLQEGLYMLSMNLNKFKPGTCEKDEELKKRIEESQQRKTHYTNLVTNYKSTQNQI